MTCRDCKNKHGCTEKEYLHDDLGESWAEWCDDFESRKKCHTVVYKGIMAAQSEINYHINMIDLETGRYISHISCTEHHSKHWLKKTIKGILKLRRTELC